MNRAFFVPVRQNVSLPRLEPLPRLLGIQPLCGGILFAAMGRTV